MLLTILDLLALFIAIFSVVLFAVLFAFFIFIMFACVYLGWAELKGTSLTNLWQKLKK